MVTERVVEVMPRFKVYKSGRFVDLCRIVVPEEHEALLQTSNTTGGRRAG